MIRKLFFVVLLFTTGTLFSQSYLDFYFKSKDIDGAIIIYNETQNTWIFNNEFDVKEGTPPGATFHLLHALIGLDLGLLSEAPEIYERWDGINRYYFGNLMTQWNCNTNLDEALYYSNDWYFDRLAHELKPKDYYYFLNRLQYSNRVVRKDISGFWNYGGLLVTPEQQLEFLKKLYHNKLPFATKNQQYVLGKMLVDENPDYTLYGYNAYTVYKGKATDWWIGILKTRTDTYYFSTRIYKSIEDIPVKDFAAFKYTITFEIFKILKMI